MASFSYLKLVAIVPMTFILLGTSAELETSLAQTHMKTSEPKPVNPNTDNSPVRSSLITTLAITFDVHGTEVRIRHIQMVLAPPPHARRREKEETIQVRGLNRGLMVSSIEIPDERVNSEHTKGLVTLKDRTLTAMLPLPTIIEHVHILLHGASKAIQFDVREHIKQFCYAHTDSSLCSAPHS